MIGPLGKNSQNWNEKSTKEILSKQ